MTMPCLSFLHHLCSLASGINALGRHLPLALGLTAGLSTFALTRVYAIEQAPPNDAGARLWLDRAKLTSMLEAEQRVDGCVISGRDLSEALLRTMTVTNGTDQSTIRKTPHRAEFLNVTIEGPLILKGEAVPQALSFSGCTFEGELDLSDARFAHDLAFSWCIFQGSVRADKMQVSGSFDLENSTFPKNAKVLLRSAQIEGLFKLKGTHFKNDSGVNCEWLSVSGSADLTNAEFTGFANFYHSMIKGLLFLTGAEFNNGEKCADFSCSTVAEDILVSRARFAGNANWNYVRARGLYLDKHSVFQRNVTFDGLKIDNSVSLETCDFAGSVSLRESQISQDLNARSLLVGSDRNQNTETGSGLDLSRVRVLGTLYMNDANVSGPLRLNDADVSCLDISNFHHERRGNELGHLGGLSVKTFYAGNPGDQSWEQMLAFVSAAEFDPRIYVELEEFLKGKGEMDFATRVFLERNDRFRDERAHGVNWWSRYLLGIVAGYGRAPERSLIPCALVVLFGCFVFWDDRKMKPNEQKFEGRRYNPLWYSLDLFAPIIDLEAAKVWSPLPTETFKWFYFRLQRILGWLLVPIAIAAFTGFLHT